jgi:leader peptidase (prepilin peptidase) / N-methyltransferase
MLDALRFAGAELPWFFPVVVFLFGTMVGSFLNVCIYRIPAGKSVVTPGSHCACGKPVEWYDNIPILSWFLLRGKARCCGAAFSFRYPFVEALTGALFLAAWLRFEPAVAIAVMVLLFALIASTFIDIDHMIIPDRFSIGWMLVGVVVSILVPGLHEADPAAPFDGRVAAFVESMLGVLVGSGVVLWILILAETVLKKEAMGFGDVKLMGAIGAFCGWQGTLFAIFGGAILGTLYVLVAAIWQRVRGTPAPAEPAPGAENPEGGENEPIGFGQHMPFGPMLAAGAALYLLWLQPWFDDYLAQMNMLLVP